MTVFSFCVPFVVLWDMINLGVLLGFNLTNTSLIMVRYGNGGGEAQPRVTGYLLKLWIFAVVGAYTFWLGYAEPVMSRDDEDRLPSVPLLLLGSLSLALAVGMIFMIYWHGRMCEVENPVTTFRAPLVPFIPGIAGELWVHCVRL